MHPVRRGIASLELVLVLPMLLLVVAMLFLVARADVAKMSAATAARRDAWQQRPNADPGGPFRLLTNPQDSQVGPPAQRSFPLDPLFRKQVQTARSQNPVVGNSWDSRAVPFRSLANNVQPHYDVLGRIPGMPGGGVAFDPNASPGLENATDDATKVLAAVTAQADVINQVDAVGKLQNAQKLAQAVRQIAMNPPKKKGGGGGLGGVIKDIGTGNIAGLGQDVLGGVASGLGIGADLLGDLLGQVGGFGKLLKDALGSYTTLLDQANSALDFVGTALSALHNLDEAIHGRPGG